MKAKTIKKTLDIPKKLNEQIDGIIEANYGLTFTLIARQALEAWLEDPRFVVSQKNMAKGKTSK
ncbi:hypothetical protein ACNQKP_02545 [Bdellovibrio bacteriovorus]|uniref:hypothetical protein n=1 Tax=Bdellovibrio bacteriovorus TaxID=959 RepID=UPI003AA995D7